MVQQQLTCSSIGTKLLIQPREQQSTKCFTYVTATTPMRQPVNEKLTCHICTEGFVTPCKSKSRLLKSSQESVFLNFCSFTLSPSEIENKTYLKPEAKLKVRFPLPFGRLIFDFRNKEGIPQRGNERGLAACGNGQEALAAGSCEVQLPSSFGAGSPGDSS